MKKFYIIMLTILSNGVNAVNSDIVINASTIQPNVTIALPANPNTGYQWIIKTYDKTLLHLAYSHYTHVNTSRIGTGGRMVYTFTVVKRPMASKKTLLVFNYMRPWEPEKNTLQRVVINFQANPLVNTSY
jgi:inhibitor of cysteine peptidase